MKLYDSIEYLYELRTETEWHRRIAWDAFCKLHEVSGEEIRVIRCFVQNKHMVHSKSLCELYPTPKEWFEKGAFEQATLDTEFHAMIKLLSTFSFV